MAKYPWDKCIKEQTARYGSKEKAEKVCGSIFWKYGPGKGKRSLVPEDFVPDPVVMLPDDSPFATLLSEIEGELGFSTCPKLFELYRQIDETGVSGTGVVAHGVQFVDGTVVLRWVTDPRSTAVYDGIGAVKTIHGHGENTKIVWYEEA